MRRAVIVSHGQPGNPEPQQRAIEDLAAAVARNDPGCEVLGATLADPDGLARCCDDDTLVYPMFMAEGWFTGTELPRRLARAGAGGARVMRPFGTDPGLPPLIVAAAHQAAIAQGWDPHRSVLLMSAHGSQRSQASFNITSALADLIAPHFARVVVGFVEQAPFLADAARGLERAVSLPMFALQAEHVTDDLPTALNEAGFSGPRLQPVGQMPQVPAMIAAALRTEKAHLQQD